MGGITDDGRRVIQRLLAMTGKLLEERMLERTARVVTDAALELLPGDHASMRILDASGTRLISGARSGVGLENEPLSFRFGEGAVGWVAAMGKPLLLEDVTADERFKPSPRQGFEIHSLLAVPLWAEGKVIGVLGSSSPEVGAFDDDLRELATLLANCASPFLEKALAQRLAITDPVTLALRQGHLLPRLAAETEHAWRNRTALSVVTLELEGLEGLDPDLDRGARDRLLRAFVGCTRRFIRPADVLVRQEEEGDRFVVVLPRLGAEEAAAVAGRLRQGFLEQPLEGLEVSRRLRVGVAEWDGAEPGAALLARAVGSARID